MPPKLTNHQQTKQGPSEQLAEVKRQVGVLAKRTGLNGTERLVLNLVKQRLDIGLVLTDGDHASMTALWAKHGQAPGGQG